MQRGHTVKASLVSLKREEVGGGKSFCGTSPFVAKGLKIEQQV